MQQKIRVYKLTDVTGTCDDEGLFFVHSSELEDDEEVGVMGTELLPVNNLNQLVNWQLTLVGLLLKGFNLSDWVFFYC